MLVTVELAWNAILREVIPGASTRVRLADADGLVTAVPFHATGDSPLFDKALMDGYAIRAVDYATGLREFTVIGEITAGKTPDVAVAPGTAVRIMTGAPLPEAADCVIPVELVTATSGDRVTMEAPKAKPEWNLARRGKAIKAGDKIIPAGTLLGPAQLGALAEMGAADIDAIARPTVSIVATGDELVPYDTAPGPGQIRNSNALMLASQIGRAGATLSHSMIARDNRADLTKAIHRGLESDFLVLSGGVSAGILDLVPSVLAECGCEEVFHGCNVKPGKPIWFGKLPAERAPDGRPRWIFGLPGNPVSSMVCCELFVRTGILRRRGLAPSRPTMHTARLAVAHTSHDSRPTYFPAVISRAEPDQQASGLTARPLNWQGSFDLQTVALANGFILLETPGERPAGSEVQTLLLDH